jgi:diguanylate cyclase (GGDEF)-like protein
MVTPGSAAGESFAHFLSSARRWAVWSLNRPSLGYILFVMVSAPVVTAVLLAHADIDPVSVIRAAVLLAAAIGYGEAFDRVERFRRFLGNDKIRTNHLSVWTIAGILVLPPGMACALVLLVYGHVLLMARRHKSARPHRMVFTASAATLATAAAAGVVTLFTTYSHQPTELNAAMASLLAAPTFLLLDTAIMAVGVYLATRPDNIRAVLPDRDAVLFELGTEVLGIVTGQLLLFMPWLAPASWGGMLALHRASLVRQLQIAATTDPKTTLLNAAAWRERAMQALDRAAHEAQRVAVVVIDLDFFKRVNDVHGHLMGDRVLAEVARAIRNETRARDIVGRFGGEEFVLLIDGRAAAAHAIDIATRIRERIAGLAHPHGVRVTATIGVAHGVPLGSGSLDVLLAHADAMMYEGKEAGRNRVRAFALT